MPDRSTVRLNFEVLPELKAEVETLKEESGATTLVEVFKVALRLYRLVLDARKRGDEIHIVKEDGRTQQLVIL